MLSVHECGVCVCVCVCEGRDASDTNTGYHIVFTLLESPNTMYTMPSPGSYNAQCVSSVSKSRDHQSRLVSVAYI